MTEQEWADSLARWIRKVEKYETALRKIAAQRDDNLDWDAVEMIKIADEALSE